MTSIQTVERLPSISDYKYNRASVFLQAVTRTELETQAYHQHHNEKRKRTHLLAWKDNRVDKPRRVLWPTCAIANSRSP